MITANLSIPALGAVDAALLGHLEEPVFLAGVAVGTALLAALYWTFGFLRMGTTGLTSQATGADPARAAVVLQDACLLAAAIGAAVAVAGSFAVAPAVALMTDSAAAPEAERYVAIRLFGAPIALLGFVAMGWLIGLGRTGAVLALGLLTNGVNIALDLLLIQVLDWRTTGAALATVGAETAGLALAVVLVLPRWQALRRASAPRTPWRQRVGELLALNGNLLLRTLLLVFTFTWVTAQAGRMGEAALAANAIALNLFYFASYGLDGIAQAVEILCGRALGGRRLEAFHQAARRGALWSGVLAAALSATFAIAGDSLITLYTDLPDVRAAARALTPVLLVLPPVAATSFLLDGIFIGATRGAAMRDTVAVAVLLVFLPLTWVLTPALGHLGLWVALLGFFAARGLGLAWVYARLSLRGGWLNTEVRR